MRANQIHIVSRRFDGYYKMYFKILKLQSLVTSSQPFFITTTTHRVLLGCVKHASASDIGVRDNFRLPHCLLWCRFKNDECALIVTEP